MKFFRGSVFIGFLIALASLTLPFAILPEGNHVFYGHKFILAYVSIFVAALIFVASWFKRTVTISLLSLLLAVSNLFFCVFLTVALSVFRDGHIDGVLEYGSGIYTLISSALFLLIVNGLDVYHSYKNRL